MPQRNCSIFRYATERWSDWKAYKAPSRNTATKDTFLPELMFKFLITGIGRARIRRSSAMSMVAMPVRRDPRLNLYSEPLRNGGVVQKLGTPFVQKRTRPGSFSFDSLICLVHSYKKCRYHPHSHKNKSVICPEKETTSCKDTFIEQDNGYLNEPINEMAN